MKLGLEQRATLGLQQKLVITPQLQQAIKLLQLNHVELAEMLQEELLTNPMLEVQEAEGESEFGEEPGGEDTTDGMEAEAVDTGEGSDSDYEGDDAGGEREASTDSGGEEGGEASEFAGLNNEGASAAEVAEGGEDPSQEELFQEVDWDAYFQDMDMSSPTAPSTRGDYDPDLPSLEQRISEQETLYEHLTWQLHMSKLSRDQQRAALYIIGSLDDRGWLVLEDQGDADPLDLLAKQMIEEIPEELASTNGHKPGEDELFAYWRDTVQVALQTIHRMEPVGVGARSLEECLLLQMSQRTDLEDPDLIERLVRDFLVDIENRKYARVAKVIKISLRELLDSVEVIRQLDPYPSRNYSDQPTAYISPDIYIRKVGDEFEVILNDDGLPRLKINNYYKQLLREQGKEGREFIQDKMRSAQWLLRSIHQRKRTIYRVTQSIVERQRDFLDKGLVHLKPMILRDVAEDIEMHESTISRVTTNKYVHTPQGVYELKFFFTSSLSSSEGGDDVSSLTVKEQIKQLISDEDPKKPLSDQEIVRILKSEGVNIARRTVAKYRNMLGISSSSKRKRPY